MMEEREVRAKPTEAEHSKKTECLDPSSEGENEGEVAVLSVCRRNEDPSTLTRPELADLGGV